MTKRQKNAARWYQKNLDQVRAKSRLRHRTYREKILAYKKADRRANPEKFKIIHREGQLRRYWPYLTGNQALVEYNKLLQSQNGVCAICGNPETAKRNSITIALAVDHDRELEKQTGEMKVRGLTL